MESFVKFRDANASDIPAMSGIRLSVTENALTNPARITEQMYHDYLERLGRGWVAESNGQVIGFCYADKEDASIWALFVDPDHEGIGAATGLLKLAVDWLFALGHECIRLSTAARTRADGFYAARGWTREAMKDDMDVGYRLDKGQSAAGAGRPCAAAPTARGG